MLVNLIKQEYKSWMDVVIRFSPMGSQWFEKKYGKTISEVACDEEFSFEDAAREMIVEDPGRYFIMEKSEIITVIKVEDLEYAGDANRFFDELDKLYRK